MGLKTKGKTWVDNENVLYTDLNGNFDDIYTEFNGNIDNDNIKAGAAIASTKIAVSDPSYSHSGTYDTLDDHISDSVAHGSGLSQFERFRYNVLSTGTSVCPRWYNKTGQTKEIDRIFLYSATAPTGASLIVDVNLNGTSIFNTTTANRPTIASGDTTATSGEPDTTSVTDGSYLDFDIDQVGSSVPGSDLLIVVYFV